ncbi:MAG: hypothetical protein J6U23_05705 [Clostridiales bacterium]|nr:hypothetical protein [Clostridiales bacterium]
MTKYGKIKKLASELDISKREATDLLRRAKYDLNDARDLYYIDKLGIDLNALTSALNGVYEAFSRLGEAILEAFDRVGEAISYYVNSRDTEKRILELIEATQEKNNETDEEKSGEQEAKNE